MTTLLSGSAAATVQQSATPRQWQKLVRTARRRGITLDSLVSGVPTPLAQRTNQGIMQAARQTVVSAYRPMFAELSTQERQTKALDAKRAADNKHYEEWLAAKNTELIGANQVFNQGVTDRQQSLSNQVQANYATAAGQAATNNAGRTDSVTLGNQEQAAAQSATAPQATLAGNLMAAEQSRTLAGQRIGGDLLASSAANSMLAHAASDARRVGETFRALQDIFGARTRLKAERGADVQRERTRLLDQEITKSNAQQQLNLAAEELGAKSAIAKLQAKQDRAKLAEQIRTNRADEANTAEANRIRAGALELSISAQQYKEMAGDRQFNLDARKFDHDVAVENYLRRHRLGKYDATGGKKGGAPTLTLNQRNTITTSIDRATNFARALRDGGVDETMIVRLLTLGGTTRLDDKREIRVPSFDEGVASAGWETSIGTGLTRQTIERLHNLGYVIGNRYKVDPLARRR